MLAHMSALSQGFATLRESSQRFADACSTQCWLVLATAGCRLLLKTVTVLGSCDCGGMVTLSVEAELTRGLVDRSALTADSDPGVGLITCKSVVFGQRAKQQPSARSSACGLPDSRQQG